MKYILRFLWSATRGYRLTPWRSPYLKWRIETYCGLKMSKIGFLEFWGFMWRERANHAWPALLDFWGVPNLQVINRTAHVEKCAAEAGQRATTRASEIL